MESSSYSPGEKAYFVDVLAVILRYRKLIAIITGIAALVALLTIFGGPLIGIDPLSRGYSIELSARVEPIPAATRPWIEFNISSILNSYMNSIPEQLEIYKRNHVEIASRIENDQLYAVFREGVLGKALLFTFDEKNRIASLSYSTDNIEQGRIYLREIWSRMSSQVSESLHALLSNAEQSIESKLAFGDDTAFAGSMANYRVELESALDAIRWMKSDPLFPFLGEPAVYSPKNEPPSRFKVFAVFLLGSLLFSLALAFGLNAVRNMLRDPQAMAKLKEALH